MMKQYETTETKKTMEKKKTSRRSDRTTRLPVRCDCMSLGTNPCPSTLLRGGQKAREATEGLDPDEENHPKHDISCKPSCYNWACQVATHLLEKNYLEIQKLHDNPHASSAVARNLGRFDCSKLICSTPWCIRRRFLFW